jgi:hypothetical protein
MVIGFLKSHNYITIEITSFFFWAQFPLRSDYYFVIVIGNQLGSCLNYPSLISVYMYEVMLKTLMLCLFQYTVLTISIKFFQNSNPFKMSKCMKKYVKPQNWKLVWHYLHASDPFIQQILPLKSNNFLLTKTKYKHLVDMNFVKQRFDLVNSDFDGFIEKARHIRLLNLRSD